MCERCQDVIITFKNYEIDHIIAISLAVSIDEIIQLNQLEYLRLLCSKCNQEKHDRPDFDNAILPSFAHLYLSKEIINKHEEQLHISRCL